MWQFLLADSNLWFSISLAVVLLIALIELMGMLTGLSLLNLVDDLFALDLDIDLGATSFSVLNGLGLNRVPFSIWLLLFLTSFGSAGLAVNMFMLNITTHLLPTLISVPVALGSALASTSVLSIAWNRLFPQSESSAVSKDSFEGLIAKVTVGKAVQGSPAEVVVTDTHQQRHYLLVEPMDADACFSQGEKAILVKKKGTVWWAIPYID